jgi:type I restriction enzyme R subunit
VVEAKHDGKPAGHGLAQAKQYAATLGLQFAYSTNGHGIVEFDAHTQQEADLPAVPSPADLFQRWQTARALTSAQTNALLVPDFYRPDRLPRYYQRIAIDAAVTAVVGGRRRCLLTLATGTGKTAVAFQICWKLWSAGWTAAGRAGKPRVLFLADRNKLVDDPMARDFAPFGDARAKLSGVAVRGREMHFALCQSLADRDGQPGLYRQYPPDYFDLIVVDECHRGSANDEGRWRDILTYFAPAAQLGLTAPPLRQDNRDSYAYFGNPLYTYSLAQGIADGFLAPYRVHRVKTTFDAAGWPTPAGCGLKPKSSRRCSWSAYITSCPATAWQYSATCSTWTRTGPTWSRPASTRRSASTGSAAGCLPKSRFAAPAPPTAASTGCIPGRWC